MKYSANWLNSNKDRWGHNTWDWRKKSSQKKEKVMYAEAEISEKK